MIHIENLSFRYPGQKQSAIKNIYLTLPESIFALITGPSGSGKSTLLRCLNGLVPHFSGGVIQGKIRVNGLDPIAATPKVMSQQVGFIFQDPESQFVLDRVEDEIAFALENVAMPRPEMRMRVEEVLDLLDLAKLRERRLETLSGGERQRVAIASALAFRPQIMILDEPTSQLDPKSAEDVISALVRLNQDLGLTILLSEHRLERVLSFVDQVIYLESGKPGAKIGIHQDVLEQIELAPPVVRLAKKLGWRPLPLTVKEARKFTLPHPIQEEKSPNHDKFTKKEAFIQAKNITVQYNGQPVLDNINLTLRPGELLALMGRNGAGKTTLLRSLIGLVSTKKGEIQIAGENITGKDTADICHQVAYLPQDPNALLFADTVTEELYQTLKNHGQPLASADAENLLTRLGLHEKANAYPRDLSSGERQRVALGAICITQPKALLLDEPTRGLDYQAKAALASLLTAWRDEGMAILLVTHDVEFVAGLADRVLILSRGVEIASGTATEVLNNSPMFAPQIARLFPSQDWLTVEDALQAIMAY